MKHQSKNVMDIFLACRNQVRSIVSERATRFASDRKEEAMRFEERPTMGGMRSVMRYEEIEALEYGHNSIFDFFFFFNTFGEQVYSTFGNSS